jgi:hypothetical protein
MYCFYVMEAYLKYTVGNVFTDIITQANAEAFGYSLSGYLYLKHNNHGKRHITYSLLSAGLLNTLLLLVHSEPTTLSGGLFVAFLIMAIRFSLSVTFNSLMLITFKGFPVSYLCTVFAALMIMGRLSGALGATAEGMDSNLIVTKLVFFILCVAGAVVNGAWLVE